MVSSLRLPPRSFPENVLQFRHELLARPDCDLAAFLPPRGDPHYEDVLVGLVLADLERTWRHGQRVYLTHYLERFPHLGSRATLARLARTEYELCCEAGEHPMPIEYSRRFGIDVQDWPPPTLQQTAPDTDPSNGPLDRESDASRQPPRPGERFGRFHLVARLGAGAFGEVFLAEQDDLAGRLVALKIGTDLFDESQSLAQLQHTHIVPIYSLHNYPPFQAVCMPYLGSTTLADVLAHVRSQRGLPSSGREIFRAFTDVLPENDSSTTPRPSVSSPTMPARRVPRQRLEEMSYLEVVLWVAARLAEGLAHAHDRGILHRDLKPANVLITDEGQPLLLDFNLAEDTKRRDPFHRSRAGGTLHYMAPEQLERFLGLPRPIDGRCDIYALGMILFELLTGEHPFPERAGQIEDAATQSLTDRSGPPPRLRSLNSAVTPAVEAIVRRCLEPRPEARYPSARHLLEDLDRHLRGLPLKHTPEPSLRERLGKWLRRNPRTLVTGCLLLVLVGTSALAARHRHLETEKAQWAQRAQELENTRRARAFRAELEEARLALLDAHLGDPALYEEARAELIRLLGHYRVLGAHPWTDLAEVRNLSDAERRALKEAVGEVLLILSRLHTTHPGEAGTDEALRLYQIAQECFEQGPSPVAKLLREELARSKGGGDCRAQDGLKPAELAGLGSDLAARGRFREAVPLLRRAVQDDPRCLWGWFSLGLCLEQLMQDAEALSCYTACLPLAPRVGVVHLRRGVVHLRLNRPREALEDFNGAIKFRPNLPLAHENRALAWFHLGKYREALADLNTALQARHPRTRLYFLRALVHEQLENKAAARADREEGLKRQPTDEKSWLARGAMRLPDQPVLARADFEAALRLNPRSRAAHLQLAHVLAELLRQPHAAVGVLDRLVTLHPEDVPARVMRGVLLARLGERQAAHADAIFCLRGTPTAAVRYRIACIYALTSASNLADRSESLRQLRLCRGDFPTDPETDPDLKALRELQEFRQLLTAWKTSAER